MFGTITFFHRTRGFGFIRTSPTAEDTFFHCREFDGPESALAKGTKVEFDLGANKGKPVARNIQLVEFENDVDPASAVTKDGAR